MVDGTSGVHGELVASSVGTDRRSDTESAILRLALRLVVID